MNRSLLIALFILCMSISVNSFAQDNYIGEMKWVAFNFAPQGWALCNGQIMPIAQHTALFSLIGTTYGGDGQTTFALPDVRGRVMVHTGQGAGLSNYAWGEKAGQESVTLTQAQLPSHQHALNASTTTATETGPANNLLATKQRTSLYTSDTTVENQVALNAQSVGASGEGQAHENRQPYITLHCIIALQGIFPPRN